MNQLFKTPMGHLRGISLLHDSTKTHDTAFTANERREYGLEGLLPHAI
jgi:malate dehydrogenase (oxaloacetate-decarboxylating)(NADP+)